MYNVHIQVNSTYVNMISYAYIFISMLADQDAVLAEMKWEPPSLQNRVFRAVPNVDSHQSFVIFNHKWGHKDEERAVCKYIFFSML